MVLLLDGIGGRRGTGGGEDTSFSFPVAMSTGRKGREEADALKSTKERGEASKGKKKPRQHLGISNRIINLKEMMKKEGEREIETWQPGPVREGKGNIQGCQKKKRGDINSLLQKLSLLLPS